ncbi:MAG: hypothetical protein JNL62_15450 [Bryobacterales bacterium]|nr:hypothetical protein [Bryobacterales bacterium]
MQITRFLSLDENQFLGCLSAFTDTLSGELNSALAYLRRMENRRKGAAFAFEMQLDKHRYGAMIVLERWADFTQAFAGHARFDRHQSLFDQARQRVSQSQRILEQSNQLIDNADTYATEIIEACAMAYRTIEFTFQEERKAADQTVALGPLLPEEFKEYRRVFLTDLSER